MLSALVEEPALRAYGYNASAILQRQWNAAEVTAAPTPVTATPTSAPTAAPPPSPTEEDAAFYAASDLTAPLLAACVSFLVAAAAAL